MLIPGTDFVSAKAKVCNIASKINGVRDQSEDTDTNSKYTIDRSGGGVGERQEG